MAEAASRTTNEMAQEIELLRSQLAEAQEVIRAIQSGDVDAVVVSGPEGEQVFTLKGAEYAYRALVEAMNEGAASLAPDGTVLYSNQRLADLCGLPIQRIVGGRAMHLLHDDESRAEFEAMLAAALDGQAAKCECILNSGGGGSIPVYLSIGRLKGDEPAALCMVVTDLSEQKRQRELLAAEESLRKHAELLKLSYDAIIIWRLDGGIESWNIGAQRLYGFTEGEALGCITHELLRTAHPRPWEEIQAELFQKGSWEGELRHCDRDGREIVVSARKQIIEAADGTKRVLETNRDITERKRAEEELQRSKERLELAVEVASLGEWEVNLVDLSASHSERHAHIFGYEMPSGDWSLQKFCDHVLPEHREDLKCYLENCLSGGKLDFEVPIRRLDGEVRWVWVCGRTWPYNGKPTRMFGTVMDITERKRVEQAMIQSEKLASVGRMASSIAHEINNPLEIIGNAVFLAITNEGISEEAKSYLELATQELDRVTHITRQTLAFHRSEKKPAPIDLRECTEGLLKLFTPRLNARGIDVEKRYGGVGLILANSGEIQQVISNLLTNSMDAILEHGVIRLRTSSSIGLNGLKGVRFTIADNGVGIPRDRLKQIFEAFFTTKEMVGTGLGLWVSKQILEKYGARIQVRSKLGRGTVISIVFPPR